MSFMNSLNSLNSLIWILLSSGSIQPPGQYRMFLFFWINDFFCVFCVRRSLSFLFHFCFALVALLFRSLLGGAKDGNRKKVFSIHISCFWERELRQEYGVFELSGRGNGFSPLCVDWVKTHNIVGRKTLVWVLGRGFYYVKESGT